MAADQFRCSVCLEVFTDPVTVPCGHNFCKSCIAEQRTLSAQLQCPTCKEPFDTRPDLKTFVSQVAANLRSSARRKAKSFSQRTLAIPDPVLCDVCAESKKKAVKSCLECLTSYCETHLEPHQKTTGLRRHKLTSPVDNLEDRVCRRHERPLEMFCRTDQMCVCPSCAVSDHKKHRVVSLIKAYKGKKKDVEETEARVQHLIQERLLKMEQIKQSLKLSKDDAEEVTAAVVQRCATLIKSTRKSLDQLLEVVEQKQKTTEEQAEGLIKELEEEIAELVEKSSELKQLSQTEDHFQLLQNRTSLQIKAKDWTNVQPPSSCDGTVRKAVEELETLSKLMKTLYADVELLRARLYAVDVTLDGDTANPYLILSEDGKRVVCGDAEQDLPEKPERLSSFGVLGEQSFSSGKFYYEVQVEGKTKWELGVVRGSINRKGQNTICPENGYWALWLRDGHYRALTGPSVPLFLTSRPQKVGVFVDYDEGVVSFYDADAALLVYSFTGCEFTEKLHPYFSPCPSDGGKNSTPLIISTIRQTR